MVIWQLSELSNRSYGELHGSHAHARGQRPPLAVVLPDDPRLQAINVRPQPLSDYEQLTAKANPK